MPFCPYKSHGKFSNDTKTIMKIEWRPNCVAVDLKGSNFTAQSL